MSKFKSYVERAEEQGAEIFHVDALEFAAAERGTWQWMLAADNAAADLAGWYVWHCEPGCLPEAEIPAGPFVSAKEAAKHYLGE